MSYIDTVDAAAATGEVLAMYQRQQGRFGYVPNYARVFCHRPQIMELWAALQAGIRRHIAPRRFELVTLAAALALRNSYCALAHSVELTRHFTADELRRIVRDCIDPSGPGEPASQSPLSAAERAMMRYADRMAADPASVRREHVAELSAHGFSDAGIFDIAATVAGRAFLTRLMDGLGVVPDADYGAMDPDLLALLLVGRRPAETASPRCPDA